VRKHSVTGRVVPAREPSKGRKHGATVPEDVMRNKSSEIANAHNGPQANGANRPHLGPVFETS